MITLIAHVFLKLGTRKDVVIKMSKKPRFRTSFGRQYAKWFQALIKSARQHFYHILSELFGK